MARDHNEAGGVVFWRDVRFHSCISRLSAEPARHLGVSLCAISNVVKRTMIEQFSAGKQPERVRAKSLVCYWSVKELGMNGTVVARLLDVIQSSVSRAVQRGEIGSSVSLLQNVTKFL